MPHDIVDNRETKLVDKIRETLPTTQTARFAVGYFFLSGLEAVSDVFTNVEEMQLLIGNTSNRETIEQIAEGYRRLDQVETELETQEYAKSMERYQRRLDTEENISQALAIMDQTLEAEELVSILIRLIEEGRLKVRVYTRGRLHSKAYIFDYGQIYDALGNMVPRLEDGIAIVGSSNFTLSGVTHNTELNVFVHGNANHEELGKWFDDLWKEAEPFDANLMRAMQQSWVQKGITPHEIYLKTIYELVGDRVEGTESGYALWETEISAVLADFQANAVQRAVQMIRRYRGCFVADVVGLGKSYIGTAIVKHFERAERARPLILCPATLVKMWERFNEAYQLNARVLSIGMLSGTVDDNLLFTDPKFRDRDFVLVDESHNFRNSDTQRYRILQAYLQAGDRRCALMTATPQNKTAFDIYNQIRLFHAGDITNLPIDPPHLRDYFKMVVEGERTLPSLLSNILIRRTRNEILRWYGYDETTEERVDPQNYAPYRDEERRAYIEVAGQKQFFPYRRLQTIEYSIAAAYQGLYERLREYLAGTGQAGQFSHTRLRYARYALYHYVLSDKKHQSPYNDLQRAGINLRGLMRVALFKRFESSVAAFQLTLERMLASHEAFLHAMNEGIVPAGEEAQRILYESDEMDERDLIEALKAVSGRYDLKDFDAARLREDIEHDLGVLVEMLDLVRPITPEQDAKLQTLKGWLFDGKSGGQPLADRKCLIFTQYADTARYLYENLNPEQSPRTAVIYSASGLDKGEVVGRFAPKANPEAYHGNLPEINLLISTDVLSEGLNMQDCDQVINYDLHWNPVRLIQRFGRIDRIGSEFDEIFGFNFLPESELEENLHLEEKLTRRIQEIHDTLGEDAAILHPDEQINEEAFYTIYRAGGISRFEEEDEELVDLNEAEETLRQLKEDDPGSYEQIVNLNDGLRCGHATPRTGTIALCRAGTYRQLYLVDDDGEIMTRDIPTILSLMKCKPSTPAYALPTGHNQRVTKIKRKFSSEVRSRRAEQKHTLRLSLAQRYITDQLTVFHNMSNDDDLKMRIDILIQAFRKPLSNAVKQEINAIRHKKLIDEALYNTLNKIYKKHDLGNVQRRVIEQDDDEVAPVVVCSEGIV